YCNESPLVGTDATGLSWLTEIWNATTKAILGATGNLGQWLRLDYTHSAWHGANCGRFENHILWLTSGRVWIPQSLWIVQKMRIRNVTYDCVTDNPEYPEVDASYLEAWPLIPMFPTPIPVPMWGDKWCHEWG